MRREQGSALITVLLVVFVLTMVGLAILFFMTTEDRISGTDQLQKAAFYAAEAGLRDGERIISDEGTNGGDYKLWVDNHLGTPGTYNPPDGGWAANPLLVDVPLPGIPAQGYTVTYSLYLRNNEDDVSASPTFDRDMKVNLLSEATLRTADGKTVRKVLEEQVSIGTPGGAPTQEGSDEGGTGTVTR